MTGQCFIDYITILDIIFLSVDKTKNNSSNGVRLSLSRYNQKFCTSNYTSNSSIRWNYACIVAFRKKSELVYLLILLG